MPRRSPLPRRPRPGETRDLFCMGGPYAGLQIEVVISHSTVHHISDDGWYLHRRRGHEEVLIWRPNPDKQEKRDAVEKGKQQKDGQRKREEAA